MTAESINVLFGKGKRINLMMVLYGNQNKRINYTQLSKKLSGCYANIFSVIRLLKRFRLVKTTKEGKYTYIELTRKGLEVSRKLYEIKEMLR